MAGTPRIVMVTSGAVDLFEPAQEALLAKGYDVVRYRLPEEFFAAPEVAEGASIIFGGSWLKVPIDLMDRAPLLRGLASCYTGYDGFDVEASTERDVLVANCPVPENAIAIAEGTIALLLACITRLMPKDRHLRITQKEELLRTGVASRYQVAGAWGKMLWGKTVGIIGFGRTARAMAERLKNWGCTLQVHTRTIRDWPDYAEAVSLETLLETSDVIVVLAALNPQTHHMLNAETLAKTKPGVILINMARGGLIEEQALYELARTGHFGHIALDVFETEPLPADSPLRELPATILTPHCAGHGQETRPAMASQALENIENILAAQPPRYICNPEVLPAWQARWESIAL